MGSLRRLRPILPIAVFLAVDVACGARTGLPTACHSSSLAQVSKVPNLYFVLDRSHSMLHDNKWGVVRDDIATLIQDLGKEAKFGAAEFPAVAQTTPIHCGPGDEVMPLTRGDGLPASTSGSTAATFLAATSAAPDGGTPTAATFIHLTPELVGLEGETFAILATDGGPNCNEMLTCSVDSCTANIDGVVPQCTPTGANCCAPGGPLSATGAPFDCLDDKRTVRAVADLARQGVKTFVIGIPGSEAYSHVLDEVATAGGTARSTEPFYYQVNTSSENELGAALADIANRIAHSCTVGLKAPPEDSTLVNITLQGKTVPQKGPNGWSIAGKEVTLFGASCDQIMNGTAKVTVEFGCPTVE